MGQRKEQSIVTEEPERSSQAMSFESILLEAIDEALINLGESVRGAIYFYVERDTSVKRNEIPQRLEDFSAAIQRFFGSGTPVLEALILETLSKKLNVDCETVYKKRLHIAVQEIRERSAGPL